MAHQRLRHWRPRRKPHHHRGRHLRAAISRLQQLDAASQGDSLSADKRTTTQEIIAALGRAIAGVVNMVHPGTVVIADHLDAGIDDLLDRVRRSVKERAHPEIAETVEIVETSLGRAGQLRSAGVVALN